MFLTNIECSATKFVRHFDQRSANQKQGASSYDADTGLDRMKNQNYSNLIDPEEEENGRNYAISSGKNFSISARQSATGKKDNDDFKLRNSKVNFYDSKVQLGDISKVTYYESSGIDTSYGGDTFVSQQQVLRSPIPIETTVKKTSIAGPGIENENCVTNVHISRRGSVRISQYEESNERLPGSTQYTTMSTPTRAVFHYHVA